MKSLLFKSVSILFLLFVGTQTLYSQADTVIVPASIDGVYPGAINDFINGDTTATGERNNLDRYYKLERDSIYFLNGILQPHYPLRLIADKSDETHKPPVLTQQVSPDGTSQIRYIQFFDDGLMENIFLLATQPTGEGETAQTIQLKGADAKYVFKGCSFEWTLHINIHGKGAVNANIWVEDCYFRYAQNATSPWNGRILSIGDEADSVTFINNTIYNCNAFMFQQKSTKLVHYFRFEHNTIVNTLKTPVSFTHFTNAKISNNVFYNTQSFGFEPGDFDSQDPDGQVRSPISLDTLDYDQDLLDSLGITEANRNIEVNNNCWFISSEVANYWNAVDSITAIPWMNDRTIGMFTDKTTWPNLNESNNLETEDPQFTSFTGTESMVQRVKDYRDGLETTYWGWDFGQNRFNPDGIPFPEDLTYANATVLAGAEGGFPIGDLNWYPVKKAEWADWYITDVEEINVGEVIPSKYALNQNYPNPFNPSTSLEFSLPENSMVNLSIYNILGQKVAELVNEELNAGSYKYNFDASKIASGVYIYTIRANSFTATRKMILLR